MPAGSIIMFWILFVVLTNIINSATGQFDFQVQFYNQSTIQNTGLVEIYYNNRWWLIASTNWTKSNSQVLCRSLGYSVENNFTVQSATDVDWQLYKPTNRTFICTGDEQALQYCKQDDHLTTPELAESIVQISCTGLKESHVRLVGGLTVKEGRAEVYHNGEWGTICMNGMVLSDATALCRTVGFDTKLAEYELVSRLPEATGRIWIDNLRCDGSESEIKQCKEISWGTSNTSCSHADDIYMHCYSENDIRLKSNVLYGELEFYHSGQWGSVHRYYSYNFQQYEKNAKVACLSLGFTAPVIGQYSTSNVGYEMIWLNQIECSGTEKSILNCRRSDWRWDSSDERYVVICMQTVVPLISSQLYDACEDKCYNGRCKLTPGLTTPGNYICECYTSYYYGDWCEYDNYNYNYHHNSGEETAAIVTGSVSGFIFLVVFIVGLSVFLCNRKKRRAAASSTTEVAYTANEVNFMPVVGDEGPQMAIIQPFSQSTVAGAQSTVAEGVSSLPLEPPPYIP